MDTELGCEVTWAEVSLKSLLAREINQLSSQIAINKKLKHKNLNSVNSAWVKPEKDMLVIIREIVTGGSLFDYLNRLPQPQNRLIKMWSRGILNGLEFLHSQKPEIVYKRLTSKSVKLMSSDGTVKLGDYFNSDVIGKEIGMKDEPWYCAPETFDGHYTQKSDIYSFGMVLLEMCTQSTPYKECSGYQEMFNCIMKGNLPKSLLNVKDKVVQDIIKSCLSKSHLRPTARELLGHSFFEENIEEKSAEDLEKEETTEDEQGVKKISLIILDSNNRPRSVSFEYDESQDTPEKVALEMIESLHMSKGSMKIVTEEIKKKLFVVNSHKNQDIMNTKETYLPEVPILTCSYSFENILSSQKDSQLRKLQKLLVKYYNLGKINETELDGLTPTLVKRFQKEAGMVPNGNITENLYRILKHRLVSS